MDFEYHSMERGKRKGKSLAKTGNRFVFFGVFLRKSIACIKKPAPSIPRTVLLEPYLFYRKSLCGFPEAEEIRLAAIQGNRHRPGKIQTEDLHKALGTDPVMCIAHTDGKGLCSGKSHEGLYILHGTKLNFKFPHKTPSGNCTNLIFCV